MAFFKEAPIKGLTRDRDNALLNRDRLAAKLAEAEANVIATKSLAQRAALDGDDGGLDAAEAAERAALHRHGTLAAAQTEASKLLAVLDEQLAAQLDKKTRTATAAEVTALADAFLQAGESFEIANSELVKITAKAALFVFEARGLEAYSASSAIEVPVAIGIIGELLREHGKMVLSGVAAATLPSPEAPFVPTIPVKPATRRLLRSSIFASGCSG
jgi:hypothetical protein